MKPEVESALYDWMRVHKFPQSYDIDYVCHLYEEYLIGYVHFDFVVVKCVSPVKEFKKVNDTVYCLGGVFEVKDHNIDEHFILDMDNGILIKGDFILDMNNGLLIKDDFKIEIDKYHVVGNNFLCDYTDFRNVLFANEQLYYEVK